MVIADYICITVRGGPPWGFSLQGGDHREPLLVAQVEERGNAAQVELREGDELVSLNGKSCADIPLSDAMALMDSTTDSLSLLVKRHKDSDLQDPEGIEHNFGVQEPDEGGLESTTLQIWPQRELYISESQDEAYYGESESDPEISGKAPTGPVKAVSTFEVPIPGGPKGTFNTGATVELQLSLAEHIPEASIGGALIATATENDGKVVLKTGTWDGATASAAVTEPHPFPIQDRVPLGQRGEIEVTLRGLGRGTQREEKEGEGEEGRERGCVDPETGPSGQVSFSVSSSTEAQTGDHSDSESEGDPSEPSKHRARHARLRRSESLSEKQVKEAKSKCKRIALLLTAAPNPTNKGVLMFKRRRQRAKKYTLVSYGTGETEPEESEDDEDEEEAQAVQFTLLDASESGLDDDFLAKAQGRGHILTLDWDTGLLEIEKKLDDGEDMECLPETKGKGALMFAKRRQRVDEITAEQEEMRKRGLPVEGVPLEAQAPLVSMQRSYQPQAWAPAGSGEQIASRDERIAVPAIKTGILQETRKKTTAKPMFTFKETPKMTPNPELLNLLNRQEKKPGFESEEDYLSLGAEACNFLQPSSGKKKVPPPVAPKPAINPTSPPWTPELENTLQAPSQPAQYAAGAPGEAPPPETSHPISVAAAGDRPAWHEAPPTVPENSASPPQQATVSSWSPAEPLAQPMQPVVQNHEPSYQSVCTWAPAQSEVQPQASVSTWAPTQSESRPQAPISTCAPTQNESQPQVPVTAWASAHTPPQRMNSYTRVSKALSDSPGGVGPAFEMPALRGKGAELFAKRQSRMEKYVVDSATVEANRVKNQSPTASLPGSWKYSSNIRAPPPLSYNPIQSPSYPPGAVKPGASSKTGPAPKAKAKGKGKPIKPLPALDVMKYQPYQLNSSLFTYGAAVEAIPKPASPAPTPAARAPVSQNQPIRYEKAAAVQPSGPVSAHYPASPQQPQPPVYPSHGPPPPGFLDGMSYQMAANSYQQPPIPVYQPGHTLPAEHASSPPYQQVPNPAYQPGPAPGYQPGPNPAYQQAPSPPYAVAPTGVSQPGPNPASPSSYAVPKFPVSSKAEPAAGSPVLAAPKPKFFAKKSDAQVWKPGAAAQE
ncbi:hypothetical protein GJAV_G00164790 [Gymnothorax javanicus]|nr:hypothetical protein GJAV_G00164790 [Gymnothorax javanicus]